MAKGDIQKKAVADYDSEQDFLAIRFPGRRSAGVREWGDIVIDFDNGDEPIGIELLDATGVLSSIAGRTITRDMLQDITGCHLRIARLDKSIIIAFELKLRQNETLEETFLVPAMSTTPAIAA